jgi:NAD(P)H-dependent FMN reductase
MTREPKKTLLVVAHAPSPNTQALKDAVLRGARCKEIEGVDVRWTPPLEAGADDLRAADGIILGTTENLGYMAGALKDFFDRTYYQVIEEKEGLPYALYIRAGLDGTGTKRAVTSICSGLRWNPVQDPVIFHGDWDDAFLAQAEELGQLMGAGLDAGIF